MGDITQDYRSDQEIKRINPESGTEETFYPSLYESVPEEFIKYAEKELQETEEKKKDGIQRLKKYLAGENIPCPDDYLILIVLRNCKYDIKKSESKLKRFLKSRQSLAEKLLKVDMKKVELALNENLITLLPYRDSGGRAIVMPRSAFTFEGYATEEFEVCFSSTLLFALSIPLTSICGMCYISDAKTPSLCVLYPACNFFRRYSLALLDFPIRIHRSDIFDENFILKWILAAIKPFLSKKLVKRITLHGSKYEILTKIYHPDILPSNIGGNLGLVSDLFYRQKLLEFMENLKTEYLQYREGKS